MPATFIPKNLYQLLDVAALPPAADTFPYFTSATALANASLTSVARTLIAQATQALMRTTGLGATTVGSALFTLTNPSAVTFPRFNADNSVDALSASAFRTAIGAGTGNGDALTTNPLSQFAATTSAQLAGVISDETGSGALVFATSPTLVTPTLGVATATSINKVTLTTPATGSTLTIADGKTFTSSNTLTLTATDGSTLAIGTGGTLGTAAYTAASAYQPVDATLTALAALTIAANSLTIGTGADAFSQTSFAANTFPARASTGDLVAKTITDFSLTLLDDAAASNWRTTLGLGTSAVIDTGTSGTKVPLLDGANTWSAAQIFSASPSSPGGTNSERYGSGAVASGTNSTVLGKGASSNQNNTTVIGANNTNTGASSILITFGGNTNSGSGAFLIGNQDNTFANVAVFGINSVATAADAIAMGRACSAAQYGVALGHTATASGVRSVAVGAGNTASHDYSVCIGYPITSRAAGDFCFGYAIATKAPIMRMIGGSSTTADIEMFNATGTWPTNTHASRKARVVLNIFDTAEREAIRMEASGSAALIGFLGAVAVAIQSVGGAATDAATTQTLANNLRTALINFGLCKT